MKIRFYQYSKTRFTLEVKHWYGWYPVYKYGGAFNITEKFNSKEEGLKYLRYHMTTNPAHVTILEYPTIIVHEQ